MFSAQLLYVLQLHKDSSETTAYVCSASEFLLPYPILSFGIVDAGLRKFKSSSLEDLCNGKLFTDMLTFYFMLLHQQLRINIIQLDIVWWIRRNIWGSGSDFFWCTVPQCSWMYLGRLKNLTSFPQPRMKLGITQILIKCICTVPISICLIVAINTSVGKLTHSWLLWRYDMLWYI